MKNVSVLYHQQLYKNPVLLLIQIQNQRKKHCNIVINLLSPFKQTKAALTFLGGHVDR